MKKICISTLLTMLGLLFAAPSFALDLNVSGSLLFEGFYNENASSRDSDKSDSYRDMRLRVKTEAKVTDKITIVTRFDALDKVLSSNDSALIESGEDDDNIDFDRAYAKIITPVGLFVLGRQEGVTWGTSWSDDEADTDRIKYILPIPVGNDKFYFAAVAEKVTENDKGYETSGQDNDKYYISGTYVSKNFRGGLLWGFYDFSKFQDPKQAALTKTFTDAGGATQATEAGTSATVYSNLATAATADGDATAAATYGALAAQYAADPALLAYQAFGTNTDDNGVSYGTTTDAKVHLISPYFIGTFGDFGVSTELDYVFGKAEYDTGAESKDINAYSFMFEGSYKISKCSFQIGFANNSGDADNSDSDIGCMGFVAPGADWAKMFILSSGNNITSGNHDMNTSLGAGLGNHIGDGFATDSTAMLDGYQMIYLGAKYQATEKMSIECLIAKSTADDVPSGVDDDQGMEYDVNFSYDIMENINYSATAAYLAVGDYWKDRSGDASADENTMALYHKIEITF